MARLGAWFFFVIGVILMCVAGRDAWSPSTDARIVIDVPEQVQEGVTVGEEHQIPVRVQNLSKRPLVIVGIQEDGC
jgi:hypothetical protein